MEFELRNLCNQKNGIKLQVLWNHIYSIPQEYLIWDRVQVHMYVSRYTCFLLSIELMKVLGYDFVCLSNSKQLKKKK